MKYFVLICFLFLSVLVVAQPSNNNCPGQQLISNSSCNSTWGSVYASTQSSLNSNNYCTACPNLNICDGGTLYCGASPDNYDVFYNFEAQSNTHTVTLSNYASNFDGVLELRSGCSFGCSNLIGGCDPTGTPSSVSITYSNLNPGSTYYIRVYEYNYLGTPPSSGSFYICVTHPCSNPSTPQISGDDEICQGESTTLSVNNTCSGCSYDWSNGDSGSSISVSSGGNYSVTASNSCGSASSSNFNVTVNSSPNVNISPNNPTICPGGSTDLTASGANSYSWNNGQNGAQITINNSGSYSVTGTSSGCTATANTFVSQSNSVNVSISPSNPTICPGGSTILTASGANSYNWNNGQTGPQLTVNSSGNYSVTGTSSGCTATASTTVNQSNSLSVSISPSSPAICSGQSVTLTASGASSYSWNNGQQGAQITVNNTGNYSVTGTDNTGCSGTASVNVTSQNSPTVSVSANQSSINPGDNSTLSVSPPNAASYQWSEPGVNGSNPTVSPSVTTTYSVTVTDANGCTGTGSVTVDVIQPGCENSTISVSPQSFPTVDEAGGSQQSFTITFDPSANDCDWSINSNCPDMISNINPSTITSSTQVTTTVTFDVSNNSTGSNRNCELTINYANTESLTYTINQSGGGCSLSKPTINASSPPNLAASSHSDVDYEWYKGNGIVGSGQFYTATESGCYKVRIIDQNDLNCFVDSDPECITVNPPPDTTTTIVQSDIVQNLQIFPNPNTGQFYVNIETKGQEEVQLVLLTLTGKEIYSTNTSEVTGKNTYNINLDNISSGMYLLRVSFGASTITRKVFIQR